MFCLKKLLPILVIMLMTLSPNANAKVFEFNDETIDFGDEARDWEVMDSDCNTYRVLIRSSISAKPTKDSVIATAWFMQMATAEGFQKKTLDTKYAFNVKYLLIKKSFDKVNRTSTLLKLIYLDDKTRILRESKASNPVWHKITPETKGENEFESVFKALQ